MLSTYYDYRLVALSILIAVAAAYAGLDLATRVTVEHRRFRLLWTIGGAFAMGTAIWSMHFTGMLAFRLPVAVLYDPWLVLASLAAAILASLIALTVVRHETLSPMRLILGAFAMGGGIAAMHYIGMAAMRLQCTCLYDARIVAFSVVIAVVFSGIALASFRANKAVGESRKLLAAALLGLAISSMHYTGMRAASFWPSSRDVNLSAAIGISDLEKFGIVVGTFILLAIAVSVCLADRVVVAQSLQLQSTQERYRFLYERSMAGIYRATLDGCYLDMNSACAELLGYPSHEEAISKSSCFHHLSREDTNETLQILSHSKRLPPREIRIDRFDGTSIWVMHSAALIDPIGESPGEIQGMFLSIDDLKKGEQELRSAKQILEKASSAKSQFLSNMSHELRTPLNAIIGLTDLIIETSEISEDDKEALQVVRSSGHSLLKIVSSILTFSTLDGSQVDLSHEDFDLRELIDLEAAPIAESADEKGLTFISEISPELRPLFRSDPSVLRQILSGLLSNAVKFTDEGSVTLRTEVADTSELTQLIKFSVGDTGVGIPPEKGMAIFEPFNQVDNSDTRRFGGTGLGLAIVSRLVDAMNGQISFQSEVGKGSIFSVSIPLRTPKAPASLPIALMVKHSLEPVTQA